LGRVVVVSANAVPDVDCAASADALVDPLVDVLVDVVAELVPGFGPVPDMTDIKIVLGVLFGVLDGGATDIMTVVAVVPDFSVVQSCFTP